MSEKLSGGFLYARDGEFCWCCFASDFVLLFSPVFLGGHFYLISVFLGFELIGEFFFFLLFVPPFFLVCWWC